MIACISVGGPHRTISVKGRIYRFEMHPATGPWAVTKAGEVAANQPGARDPFWEAVTFWDRQGRRLDAAGRCAWDYPPRPILRHLAGRQYEITGYEPGRPGS
jgi:hypothetical protein